MVRVGARPSAERPDVRRRPSAVTLQAVRCLALTGARRAMIDLTRRCGASRGCDRRDVTCEEGAAMGDVVVGIDGSPPSLAALRMAADEAHWRSARLHVVYVYEPTRRTSAARAASVLAAGTEASPADDVAALRAAEARDEEESAEVHRHAEGLLRQLVTAADADLDGLEVLQSAVAEAHPSAALVRLSQDADLLVVGSRGLGGFRGLLLGSVGQQCVQHATCPVLVVRV
jgi:nucleotide-binding universal stress UspA family protein